MTDSALYSRGSQFRITVLAPSVADVVECAGGWIFDRVRMGWAVSVGIAERPEDRPLRILGADLLDFDVLLASVHDESTPSALTVSAKLHAHDSRARDAVSELMGRRDAQVTMWGDQASKALRDRLEPTQYRLSSAARIFKAHALDAAGAIPTVTATETFRQTRPSVAPILKGIP